MSECSNFSEDEDDDEGEEGGMGNFTSTVCVNFSEDDLRLATIPGQVRVTEHVPSVNKSFLTKSTTQFLVQKNFLTSEPIIRNSQYKPSRKSNH